MIVMYHNHDLDGWMSAAIVKLRFPDVKLIGWDYGSIVPDVTFQEVIMVDVSLLPTLMKEMRNRTTWIDHHASAINDSIKNNYSGMSGIRDSSFAACELTWKYFFPDSSMPEIVRLLGRYDCFGHKGTAEELKVLEFQYGAQQFITGVDDAFTYLKMASKSLFRNASVVESIHHAGKTIYKYLCSEAKQIYARRFTETYAGYKIAMINVDRFNPVNFGIDYHADGYDIAGCFWFVNGKWSFSFYNDNGKVDVSELCKMEGGGGHKGAAGFVKDDIGWLFRTYLQTP
jgi:uncharacterized protein